MDSNVFVCMHVVLVLGGLCYSSSLPNSVWYSLVPEQEEAAGSQGSAVQGRAQPQPYRNHIRTVIHTNTHLLQTPSLVSPTVCVSHPKPFINGQFLTTEPLWVGCLWVIDHSAQLWHWRGKNPNDVWSLVVLWLEGCCWQIVQDLYSRPIKWPLSWKKLFLKNQYKGIEQIRNTPIIWIS